MAMQGVSIFTAGSMDVQGVFLSTNSNVDMQEVSISVARSIDMHGVSLSTASSTDESVSTFHNQQNGLAGYRQAESVPILAGGGGGGGFLGVCQIKLQKKDKFK